MTVQQARIAAHKSFDLLWKFGHMTRSEAYAWLAKVMHQVPSAHMINFNEEQCLEVIEHVKKYWENCHE